MDKPVNTKEVNRLFSNFITKLWLNFYAALKSGAFAEGTNPLSIARMVLVITAESFAPTTEREKKELANLRHFI